MPIPIPVLIFFLATVHAAAGFSSFVIRDSRSRLKRQSGLGENPPAHETLLEEIKAEMASLEVDSVISSRFAETIIECEMYNNHSDDRAARFEVFLPVSAFVSNFTMEVDGDLLVGEVMSHADAAKVYVEVVDEGESAGLVALSNSNPNTGSEYNNKYPFLISTNVRSKSSAIFTLTYQELLRRSNGRYRHDISVKPKKILNNLAIKVIVKEPQGIQFFSVEEPSGSSYSIVKAEAQSREVIYRPTRENQYDMNAEGLDGDFTVSYDTNHPSEAGEILTEDETFAHFFSPDNNELTPISKKIVFVIDVSGSMKGTKIEQTAQAMEVILDQMREDDIFMLILFEANIKFWPSTQDLVKATASNVAQAKRYLTAHLRADGGTNINDALISAASSFNSIKSLPGINMIIFLTDGDATSGETDENTILNNVVVACGSKISIFAVSIGASLDFEFLKKLSLKTAGTPYRIDTTVDIAENLHNFFSEIDDPLLSDVLFDYDEDIVAIESITSAAFPRIFNGSEVIVAGKLKTAASGGLQATVSGNSNGGQVTLQDAIIRDVSEISEIQRGFLQKLYIYLRIQDLFKNRTIETDASVLEEVTRQATDLAIRYSLVTPLTSMVVYESLTVSKGNRMAMSSEVQEDNKAPPPLPPSSGATNFQLALSHLILLLGLFALLSSNYC